MVQEQLFGPAEYSALEIAIAEQIAIEKGRSEPDGSDYALAVKMAFEWQRKRVAMGFKEWL